MKKRNTLLLMLFFTTIAFAQGAMETHKKQFQNLVQESFDEIWSKLEAKNIEKFYTKDFLLLEHGEVWNNDTIAIYLNKAKLKLPIPKRVNKIEIIDVKVTNKTAWVAYHNYATISIDDKIIRKLHWLESATAILTDKGWKFDMLHSTRVKSE